MSPYPVSAAFMKPNSADPFDHAMVSFMVGLTRVARHVVGCHVPQGTRGRTTTRGRTRTRGRSRRRMMMMRRMMMIGRVRRGGGGG